MGTHLTAHSSLVTHHARSFKCWHGLSDPEMWSIAENMADDELPDQIETLAERQKQYPLTAVEQSRLTKLMARAQLFMLRKTEAYRLLARRGYALFSVVD